MNIQSLVLKLKESRAEKKKIEKEIKEIEPQIKEELESRGIDKLEFPDVETKITYSTVNKSAIDENVLLEILENEVKSYTDWGNADVSEQIKECIVMKPTVDEEKVQELIYKGILSVECIQPAYIDKSYKVLKISKCKK